MTDTVTTTAEGASADLVAEKPIRGGRNIAAYFDKPLAWLRRQRERSKCPPPVWRSATGGELLAYPSELKAWDESRKPKS
jgi:hypothetical protein